MKTLKTLTLLIAMLIASHIYAQPVTLDPTFGQNGITGIQAGFGTAFVFDRLGNIVTTGVIGGNMLAIIKMNADGIIDQNFGTNGQILVPENYILSGFNDLKVTNENKILLLGTHEEADVGIILRRFNEKGSVDSTFGDNGIMNLSAITGALYSNPIRINSVNLESDDFMLIAITEYTIPGWTISKSYVSKYDYDVELDESFGENGKRYLTDNETFRIFAHPKSIKILRDQSIVIAGYDNFNFFGEMDDGGRLAFCKLSPTGHFITDFAHNGIWKDDGNSWSDERFLSIIEDTNGNLVFIGVKSNNFGSFSFIHSFYSNGTINSDFGTNGYYEPFMGAPSIERSPIRILQNGNKYLVRNRYNILSLNRNGTVDITFNNTGVFRCENSTFRAMELQDTTKLIVLGSLNDNFAIARLNIPYEEVSIKEIPYTENRVNIFPNPTTGKLTITNCKLQITDVEVFDVYGRKLLSHTTYHTPQTTLDISHFPTGIYLVKIGTGACAQIQKIIKH